MPKLSDPSSIALLALSNRGHLQVVELTRILKWLFSNITTCVTNRFIHLEIHDMSRSFFPFIHQYKPSGLIILQLPWFLVNSFDGVQGKLGEVLKIEITGRL